MFKIYFIIAKVVFVAVIDVARASVAVVVVTAVPSQKL